MSLPDALEAAASALPSRADAIRPANGDPVRLLEALASDAAAEVLAWLLAERPDEGEELAEAWEDEPGGVEPILAVNAAALPKAGRKVLRRVRHRLRSRGVAVAEEVPPPVVATLASDADAFSAAYVSHVDPMGARIVYLAERHPGGGVRLFEVVVDDARGVVGFDVYSAPRRKARAFLERLGGRDRFPVVEVAPDAARAVVAHAAARQTTARPAPRAFLEWRHRVAEPAPGTRLPGEEVAEALEVPDEGEAVPRAAERVREGQLGPWPPAPEVLHALFEKMRAALDSPLVVSPATRREQLDRLLEEAADEVYDADGAALAAHRLRESAFVAWRRNDEETAGLCLAAARAFASGAPRENPVARALLEAALRPALEALERELAPEAPAEEEAEAPLLVRP